MSNPVSFRGCSIVACGTMRPELNRLKEEGFLDADKVLFTGPGLHDKPVDLEQQLVNQLHKAAKISKQIIVVFGKRCFLDMNRPELSVESIIEKSGGNVSRIQAGNCVDFLADETERERIAAGRKIYWLTPGWMLHWRQIFKDWDVGLANEMFPAHDTAILLDPVGAFEDIAVNDPETLLEFSDFMKIGIEPAPVTLDRFKSLLVDELRRVPR